MIVKKKPGSKLICNFAQKPLYPDPRFKKRNSKHKKTPLHTYI